MAKKIDTLQKIVYKNLKQFEDDVNSNFAVIQNSPLFKGVSGEKGSDGQQGLRGIRGSKFFVVDVNKFIKEFPNSISSGNQIDLVFLNEKLKDKNKLLNALDTTSLIDNDIVVLTNSVLLMYKYSSNSFYNTGLSFNTTDNLINDRIEKLFKNWSNQFTPTNNVFKEYVTYSKDYPDNSNLPLSSVIKSTSVFAPFIDGITKKTIEVTNHNYYGVTDTDTTKLHTLVIGNMEKYYEILMKTISLDNNSNISLNSSYAVGNGNMPSLVILQNTTNNGIMFGNRNSNNMKSFASIYKDENDNVVIKTNTGNFDKLQSGSKTTYEATALMINNTTGLRYTYNARIDKNLDVYENLQVKGDISNSNLQTGKFAWETMNSLFGPNISREPRNQTIIGSASPTGNVSTIIQGNAIYMRGGLGILSKSNYYDKVLVTDNKGLIKKSIILEKYDYPQITGTEFTIIPEIPENGDFYTNEAVLTTNYLNEIIKRINLLYTSKIDGLYWTKREFETNIIPTLKLNDSLFVDTFVNFGNGKIVYNNKNNIDNFSINSSNLSIDSTTVEFKQFKNKILAITDNGLVRRDVEIDKSNPYVYIDKIETDITTSNSKQIEQTTYLLTRFDYNNLIKVIKDTRQIVYRDYWQKKDWQSGIIPYLFTTSIFSKHITLHAEMSVDKILNQTYTTGAFFHSDATNTILYSNNVVIGPNTTLKIYSNKANHNQVLFLDQSRIVTSKPLVNEYNYLETDNVFINELKTKTGIIGNVALLHLYLRINNLFNEYNDKLNRLTKYIGDSISNLINTEIIPIKTNIRTLFGNVNTINNHIKSIIGIPQNQDINFNGVYSLNALKTLIDDLRNDVTINQTNINLLTNRVAALETSNTDLINRVNILEQFKTETVQLPKNAIILWKEHINGIPTIPEGWEIVDDLMGRFPLGWKDFTKEFNNVTRVNWKDFFNNDLFKYLYFNDLNYNIWKINNKGGNVYVKLENYNLPEYFHTNYGIIKTDDISVDVFLDYPKTPIMSALSSPFYAGKINKHYVGNNIPHNNIPPYSIVCFLKSKKGINKLKPVALIVDDINYLYFVYDKKPNTIKLLNNFNDLYTGNIFKLKDENNNLLTNYSEITEFKVSAISYDKNTGAKIIFESQTYSSDFVQTQSQNNNWVELIDGFGERFFPNRNEFEKFFNIQTIDDIYKSVLHKSNVIEVSYKYKGELKQYYFGIRLSIIR